MEDQRATDERLGELMRLAQGGDALAYSGLLEAIAPHRTGLSVGALKVATHRAMLTLRKTLRRQSDEH